MIAAILIGMAFHVNGYANKSVIKYIAIPTIKSKINVTNSGMCWWNFNFQGSPE